MYVSQSIELKAENIQGNYYRNNISNLNKLQNVQDCQINISSFCDLLSSSDCSSRIITQKVYFITNYLISIKDISPSSILIRAF